MRAISCAVLAVCASGALAQDGLVVGVDDTTVDVQVYQNGSWSTLFTGAEVWGLAAVESQQRIYYNSGSTLHYWSSGTGIVDVGTIQDENGTTLAMVSLDYNPADDQLYATRNIGGDGGATPEGLYRIDRTTGVASLVEDYDSLSYDIGGISFDDATGRLFGTNDDATPARGLYEFDMPGLSQIAPYPGGEIDIDALAVYNNTAYLVTDQPGNFYMLDVTNPGAGYTAFANPFSSSEIFSGATVAQWLIPSPGTAGLLALGAIAATRRRR